VSSPAVRPHPRQRGWSEDWAQHAGVAIRGRVTGIEGLRRGKLGVLSPQCTLMHPISRPAPIEVGSCRCPAGPAIPAMYPPTRLGNTADLPVQRLALIPGRMFPGPLLEDLPSVAWIANLAALKLHVTEWRNWGGIYVLTRLARDSR
jgi:hypothetical protein